MTSVLHFRRQLDRPPAAVDVPDICVRNMKVPEDVASWLDLRDRAMADQSPRARSWNEHDFRSEMQAKSWWRCDHTWLALAGELRSPDAAVVPQNPATRRSPANVATNVPRLIGSITLAMREGPARTAPVVHWLLVDPAFRRRGIARLLMQHLEQTAWNEGWREIELETHAGWTAAVAFYQSIGYEPVRDRSPR